MKYLYGGHRSTPGGRGFEWLQERHCPALMQGVHSRYESKIEFPISISHLFVWGSEASSQGVTTPRRCALTTAISQDEGKTFIHQRNIARDPEDDYGYQCIEFIGQDLAVVGYHCRDGLRVARIGIDWFYER